MLRVGCTELGVGEGLGARGSVYDKGCVLGERCVIGVACRALGV